ncbi:MAG: glycosyltransferase family 2 protein [Dehalococcoidia bacterium]
MILAVRDEAPAIEACLAALAAQTYPAARIEVILVDGQSDDDTVKRAAGFAARAPLRFDVISNERRNAPAGFNRGIEVARGDVLIVLGARARVEPDFVEASVRALERTRADAVGGVVTTVAGGPGRLAGAIALAQRSPFGVGDAGYRYADSARAVDTVNYGAYRREVFERIGFFDESMQWVEDDEFNYRLRAAGGRILLDPSIKVTYAARPTLRGLWQQRYRWGLNKLRVAERHPAQMQVRHAVPALFVAGLSGAIVIGLRGGRWCWPIGTLAGSYGIAALAATLRLGARHGWPRATPLLPAAFLAMHLAYGSGTLVGLAGMVQRQLASKTAQVTRR